MCQLTSPPTSKEKNPVMSLDMNRQMMSRRIANKQVRGCWLGMKVVDDFGINHGCWTIGSGELVDCILSVLCDLYHDQYQLWYYLSINTI